MVAINFTRFCTPAQLYLILAGISLITAFFNDFQVITLVVNGIFVLIWGWILNWLCSKGLKTISWILVLLPFIFFIFTFFFAKDILTTSTIREGGPNSPEAEAAFAAANVAAKARMDAQKAAHQAKMDKDAAAKAAAAQQPKPTPTPQPRPIPKPILPPIPKPILPPTPTPKPKPKPIIRWPSFRR